MANNQYPQFFHIGTQKAGSTYLYNMLSGHSQAALSELSEVDYFTKNYSQGIDWYISTFKKDGVKIDTSPKYFMLGAEAAPRIKEYEEKYLAEGKAKFLLILRNPIDYLNSHFNMQLNQGFFQSRQGGKIHANAVDYAKDFPDYLERAYYYKTLVNWWLKCFSLDRFKIIIFEEFVADKNGALEEIQNFFDLPVEELKANLISQNRMPRFKFLNKAQRLVNSAPILKAKLKESEFFNKTYNRFFTKESKMILREGDRRYLRDVFYKDVRQLEILIKHKIDAWKDFY